MMPRPRQSDLVSINRDPAPLQHDSSKQKWENSRRPEAKLELSETQKDLACWNQDPRDVDFTMPTKGGLAFS